MEGGSVSEQCSNLIGRTRPDLKLKTFDVNSARRSLQNSLEKTALTPRITEAPELNAPGERGLEFR